MNSDIIIQLDKLNRYTVLCLRIESHLLFSLDNNWFGVNRSFSVLRAIKTPRILRAKKYHHLMEPLLYLLSQISSLIFLVIYIRLFLKTECRHLSFLCIEQHIKYLLFFTKVSTNTKSSIQVVCIHRCWHGNQYDS